jgi:PHD finger protein 20
MESGFKPTKHSYVCSRHFKRENFTAHSTGKIVLKSQSTPSIFPWNRDEILAAKAKATTETKPETSKDKPEKVEEQETPKKSTETKKKPKPKKVTTPAPKTDENVKKSKRLSAKLSTPKLEEVKPSSKSTPKSSGNKKVSKESTVVEEKPETETPASEPLNESVSDDKKSEINFVPGVIIEAQNFDEKWVSVKIVEIDLEEREVLVQSLDKNFKHTTRINDEWISMDSPRLRPLQPVQKFEVGEKVLARWNDCRKFPATIRRVLENNTYDVLFYDGYPKIVRGVHINKFNSKNVSKIPDEPILQQPINPLLLNPPALTPDYIKAMTDVPKAPTEGEWCCAWVDDIPIGEESTFDGPHGKLPSIVVPDWRVKEGWQKHIYLRQNGKWDVLFISPTNRKLRFKNELKNYLFEIGETYDPEAWDFSLHKKKSKLLGLCITTDKLKTQNIVNENVNASQPFENPFASLGALPYIQQNLVLPIHKTSEVHVGALKVKIIDNIYQCPQETCDKTFRKENHLQLHIKHYHEELAQLMGDCPNMEDLAYLRTTNDEPELTPTKPTRRSHGLKLKKDEIKSEIVSPVIKNQKSPILEGVLKSSTPIIESLLSSPTKSEVKQSKSIYDKSYYYPGRLFDPETLIPPHKVSKSSITKSLKRKSKFGSKRLTSKS